MKVKAVHPLGWVAEPLEDHPTFARKKMFGCEMLCLHDRQALVLAAKDEPWNGLLVCTSREHHASLMMDFPALKPHSVLGKWLYVSQAHADFEELAVRIARHALRADPRLGVESKLKSRKSSGDGRRRRRTNRSPRRHETATR